MSAFSVMATSAAGTLSSAAGYDERESSEEVETESRNNVAHPLRQSGRSTRAFFVQT